MVALPHRQRLNLPLAPLVAGLLAAFIALVFALLPADMLGNLVLDSGIASLVPAAEPPLGATARAALIMIGGGGVGLVAWFALFLLVGTRSITLSAGRADKNKGEGNVPVLRRADAHPDAPARRPLFANEDLGTPFLEVRAPVHVVADEQLDAAPTALPAERDIPLDLDVPLSAYDPQSIPEEPLDWFPPPAQLVPQPRPQVFDDGERFETFELTPLVRAPEAARPAPRPPIDPSASIHALLDRLEQSVSSRPVATSEPAPATPPAPPAREEGLQDALVTLRKLAMSR